jgi:membrane protease YdiL (CAAX protease family)
MNDPVFLLIGLGVAGYFAWLWRADLLANRAAKGAPSSLLPGALPATSRAIAIGVLGAVLLVAVETWGELRLGVAGEQTEITWLFALYSVFAAAIIEELVFRGYLVVEGKGRAALLWGAAGASVAFALAHPHLWKWEDGTLTWHFDLKAWFSTGCLFIGSLWFYACRFGPWNKNGSLLPCFTAHAAKNLAVVAVKAAQGFVVGLWS